MLKSKLTTSLLSDRQDVFKLTGNEKALQQLIEIKPPPSANETPPILSFRRKRNVEISWQQILKGASVSGSTSNAAIRDYFESSWRGGEPRVRKLSTGNVVYRSDTEIELPGPSASTETELPDSPKASVEPAPPRAVEVTDGIVFEHGTNGRLFLVHSYAEDAPPAENAPPAGDQENREPTETGQHDDPQKIFDQAWKNGIADLELVFENPEDAKTNYTDFAEVDLRPGIIRRRFKELQILRDFATQVHKHASEKAENLIGQIVEHAAEQRLDPDEVERLQDRILRLRIRKYDADRQMDRLVSQAADLGYYLFPDATPKDAIGTVVKDKDGNSVKNPDGSEKLTEATRFKFPDGTSTPVYPGELYRKFRRTARWTVRHQVVRHVSIPGIRRTWFGWQRTQTRRRIVSNYSTQHSAVVEDYSAVETEKDVLGQALAALRHHERMEVFVFKRTPEGFVTADGATTLRSVMERCEFDEAFRTRCAVLLPVYEDSITGRSVLTKYSIFKRPLPPLSATTLPQLSIEESLSYRTTWNETHLGELVSSINLAPGEERTVRITQEYQQETEVTKSSTSIFDITQSNTTDLASEMESETRQESEQSSNFQMSASVSGGWGPVSAEASASGGTSSSLKNFGQAINRVAKKAAHSVNQQSRQEVSSSTSSKTSVTSTDETTATIHNINEGRVLNLMFYRLNNRFTGGLYLEDLEFDVIPGIEVIAGSGVYESVRYRLDELPELLEQFDRRFLPFDVDDDGETVTNCKLSVVQAIESLLSDEYLVGDESLVSDVSGTTDQQRIARSGNLMPEREGTVSDVREHLPFGRSVQRARLRPDAQNARLVWEQVAARSQDRENRTQQEMKDGDAERSLSERMRRVAAITVDSSDAIEPHELLVASSGLYMDAVVGVQPSTEPYSEQMRHEEVRMRAAEVFVKESEGIYQRAEACQLMNTHREQVSDIRIVDIRVVDHPDLVNGKRLELHLSGPLPSGEWEIRVNRVSVGSSEMGQDGEETLRFGYESPPSWLHRDDLLHTLDLYESSRGESIRSDKYND